MNRSKAIDQTNIISMLILNEYLTERVHTSNCIATLKGSPPRVVRVECKSASTKVMIRKSFILGALHARILLYTITTEREVNGMHIFS